MQICASTVVSSHFPGPSDSFAHLVILLSRRCVKPHPGFQLPFKEYQVNELHRRLMPVVARQECGRARHQERAKITHRSHPTGTSLPLLYCHSAEITSMVQAIAPAWKHSYSMRGPAKFKASSPDPTARRRPYQLFARDNSKTEDYMTPKPDLC